MSAAKENRKHKKRSKKNTNRSTLFIVAKSSSKDKRKDGRKHTKKNKFIPAKKEKETTVKKLNPKKEEVFSGLKKKLKSKLKIDDQKDKESKGDIEAFYPKNPQEDPAFIAMENKAEETAKNQQKTNPAKQESKVAQDAAVVPSNEQLSSAQKEQVGEMNQQPPGEFKAEDFEKELTKQIESMELPENQKEAMNFDKHNNIDEINEDAMGQVSQETQNAGSAIASTSAKEPDTSKQPKRESSSLPKPLIGKKPYSVNEKEAMPKARPKSQVNKPLQKNVGDVDQLMADNEITSHQLEISNEPEFLKANKETKEAKEHAETAPKEFRKQEEKTLTTTKKSARNKGKSKLSEMHSERSGALNDVVSQQKKTGEKDTSGRDKVYKDINSIYEETKKKVEDRLTKLDKQVEKDFDDAASKAKDVFEDYVEEQMDAYKENRYSGWEGKLAWVGDQFMGIPDEVNIYFKLGREKYVNVMKSALKEISKLIASELNEAKKEIKDGQIKVANYVKGLKGDLKKIGAEATEEIQNKFDTLTGSVDAKKDELVTVLAQKYIEGLKEVDARIEEMKEANKGLVDKAKDAINGVIDTIKKLKKLITELLAEIKKFMSVILADPLGFVSNLFAGISKGIDLFKANIKKHVIAGFLTWITGAMGPIGITIPENIFSLSGIFNLVMQVLGLSWDFVRRKAVLLLGEPVVKAMEFGLDMFKLMREKGVDGIWEYVKEQFTDLKKTIIDAIRDMLITQVIEAGIKWLLSLLIPGAGFVKALMAIKDVIVFFVESALALIPTLIEAIRSLATGSVGLVAKAVEKGLAALVPLVIGLFAKLLNLGGLVKKVQKIIKRVRKRIDKAVTKIILKAKRKFGNFIKKGKAKVKKGVQKLLSWLKIKVEFKAKDGKKHSLSFKGNEKKAKLIVKSEPKEFEKFAQELLKNDKVDKNKVSEALKKYNELVTEKNKKVKKDDKTAQKKKADIIENKMKELSKYTKDFFGHDEEDLPEYKKGGNVFYDSVNTDGVGEKMSADVLSKKGKKGSVPKVSNQVYDTLFKRKKGKGIYYVRGHLLNHNIHGPGDDHTNLTPLSVKGNKNHLIGVEKILKVVTSLGGVVKYVVDPVYGDRGLKTNDSDKPKDKDFTDEEWQTVKEIREVESTAVPTHMKITAELLEKKGKEFVKKKPITSTKVNNPIETNLSSYSVKEEGEAREKYYLREKSKADLKKLNGLSQDNIERIIKRLKGENNQEGKNITNYEKQVGISKAAIEKANPTIAVIGTAK